MAEGEPQIAAVKSQQGITATTITKYLLQNIAPSLLLVSGLFYFVSNRMDTLAIALETRLGTSITRLDNSVTAANQRIDATATAANQRIDATATAANQRIDTSVAAANQRIDTSAQRLDSATSSATTEIRTLEDSFVALDTGIKASVASLDSEIKTSVRTLNAAVTSAADKLQSLKSVTDSLQSSRSTEYVDSFKLGKNFVSAIHFGRTLVFPRTNEDDNIAKLRATGFRPTDFQARGTTIQGWILSRKAANNPPRIVDLPAELLNVVSR